MEENNQERDVKKILIVDDEQAIRDVLDYNLKKEGYELKEGEKFILKRDVI